jgi:hypothetical protein
MLFLSSLKVYLFEMQNFSYSFAGLANYLSE